MDAQASLASIGSHIAEVEEQDSNASVFPLFEEDVVTRPRSAQCESRNLSRLTSSLDGVTACDIQNDSLNPTEPLTHEDIAQSEERRVSMDQDERE